MQTGPDKAYGRVYSIGEVKQNGHIQELPVSVGGKQYTIEIGRTCVFVDGLHIYDGATEKAIRTGYLATKDAHPDRAAEALLDFAHLLRPHLRPHLRK